MTLTGVNVSRSCTALRSRPSKIGGIKHVGTQRAAVTDDTITISQRTRFQVAMILAIVADALQFVFLPLFVEGAGSPTDESSISVLEPCNSD